jgi:hypothetical protein
MKIRDIIKIIELDGWFMIRRKGRLNKLNNFLLVWLISSGETKHIMSKKNDIITDPILYIKKIENQLDEVIQKKKKDVEKELEKRIQKEKIEAKRKIDQIEKEFAGKKEAFENYRTALAEIENNKTNIKNQKKEHLEKAIQFLKEIKTLTAKSLDELKKMRELDKKLEEINQTIKEKATTFKKDLEEEFKIEAEGREIEGQEDMKDQEEIDLAKDREKLKKIIELLHTKDPSKLTKRQTKGKKSREEEIEESGVSIENKRLAEESKDE